MKLIALRGFKNNSKELIVLEKGQETTHPDGIDKGTLFSIGGDVHVDDDGMPQKHKRLIKELSMAKCIGDSSDAKLCAKIAKEIEQEEKQREEQKKLISAGGPADMARQTVAALIEAGWGPPAKAPKGAVGAPA